MTRMLLYRSACNAGRFVVPASAGSAPPSCSRVSTWLNGLRPRIFLLARWQIVALLLLSLCGPPFPLNASDLSYAEGITEPFLDVTMSASVAGIITAQKFKEGDFVQEGDVILE